METSVDPGDLVILALEQSGGSLTPGQKACVQDFLDLPTQDSRLLMARARLRLVDNLLLEVGPNDPEGRYRFGERVYHLIQTHALHDLEASGDRERRDQIARILSQDYTEVIARDWNRGAFVRFLAEFDVHLSKRHIAHLALGGHPFLHPEQGWIEQLRHFPMSPSASAPTTAPANADEACSLAMAITRARAEAGPAESNNKRYRVRATWEDIRDVCFELWDERKKRGDRYRPSMEAVVEEMRQRGWRISKRTNINRFADEGIE